MVTPGPIVTDFNNAFYKNNAERREFLGTQTALGRIGNADDIGGVVAFLCSDEARWVNAQRIEVMGRLNL